MRRRYLLSIVVCMSFSTLAAADVGQPSSFSVTISRAPGTINADLQVETQGAVSPVASDSIGLAMVLLHGGFPPTVMAGPESTWDTRGVPTTNNQFAASFSFSVPDEHLPFKYLAIASPIQLMPTTTGTEVPPTLYSLLYFVASYQPDLDLFIQPTPPGPTPTQGATQPWVWYKGQRLVGVSVPALTLWGLVGLGALVALAGAFLMRRS